MATDYEVRALVRGQPRATDYEIRAPCSRAASMLGQIGQLLACLAAFASLVRVRGGYHAMMGSGMRASTAQRAAFLYRVLLRLAPAKEKRLHAVN